MLLLLWLVLCVVAAALLLLPLTLRLSDTYKRLSGSRLVECPENRKPAAVSIDARHAAATGMDGHPDLRLGDCTRWPERSNCDQSCLHEAIRLDPYTSPEPRVAKKQIYHLPILLAAFAGWYVGAIWHSQYLFRSRWMNAVGLTNTEVKRMVWWVWPHLLTFAIALLFAYGVAWLLAVVHRKGVLPGVLMSVLLCGAIIAASSYAIVKLPRDLVVIEAGYIVLAALSVGAIVGGLYDKLVLRSE